MGRKYLFLGLLMVCILPHGLRTPTHAQEPQSNAPYLYYYSDILNAFVIERADGSDSRIFGEGLMPSDTNTVDGAGWSPSGKWFAWQSGKSWENERKPYILNVDGKTTIDIFADAVNGNIVWSPENDRFLFAFTSMTLDEMNTKDYLEIQIGLFDVTNQSLLQSVTLHKRWMYQLPNLRWIGNYGVIYDGYFHEDRATYYVFDEAGNLTIKQTPAPMQSPDTITDVTVPYESLSINGYNAYLITPQTVTIENILTNERWFIQDSFNEHSYWEWGENSDEALVLQRPETCGHPCKYSFWLVNAKEQKVTLLHQEFENFSWGNDPIWSPDGHWAVYNRTRFLDLKTGVEKKIPIVASGVPIITWFQDGMLLINDFEGENLTGKSRLTLYDLETESIIQELNTDFFAGNAQVSSDQNYLAYLDFGAMLYNISTKTSKSFIPNGRNTFSDDRHHGWVEWHSDSQWFATMDAPQPESNGFRPVAVLSIYGDKRDLTSCYPNPACWGWLPTQVNPNNLPPGQPNPILLAPKGYLPNSSGIWLRFLEWSPDGRFLLGAGGDSIYQLWDLQTQEFIYWQEEFPLYRGFTVNWSKNENIAYIPAIIPKEWREELTVISPNGQQKAMSRGVYDVATGEQLFGFGFADGFSYSPDGRFLAMSRGILPVQIYNTQTWELLLTMNTTADAVAFSPEGKTLAVALAWEIQLWDVAELIEFGEFQRQMLARE